MKAVELIERVVSGEDANDVAETDSFYIVRPAKDSGEMDKLYGLAVQAMDSDGIPFKSKFPKFGKKEGKFIFNSERDAIEASRLFKFYKLDGRVYPYPDK